MKTVWKWFVNQIVQDVPEEIMVCEYDCRKGHCTVASAEWCEKRLFRGAGELFPLRTRELDRRAEEHVSPAHRIRTRETINR